MAITATGAQNPDDWERKQPHNIFNDRRVGGRAKNRAVSEHYFLPKTTEKFSKQSKGPKKTY